MLKDKNVCTGCGACASICQRHCIQMLEDEEGFFYPQIDKQLCIECKMCVDVCPIGKEWDKSFNTYTVCIQNYNDDIRKKSSAGGFVGSVFDFVFSKGGIIYGAGYDTDKQVIHVSANNMEECLYKKVLGSKYVSSDLNNSFIQIRKNLDDGRMVCFVGLPCQVTGLKSFLGKEFVKLITIDLTCYGVPSRKLYRKYLLYCEHYFNRKISEVNFRDKTFGYSAPTMSLQFEDGKVISQHSVIKSYLRCFFSNLSERPSCNICSFKSVDRKSDFTVGDCKSIRDYNLSWDDDKGTTVVYVHSEKAQNILKELESNQKIRILPVQINHILQSCGTKMTECVSKSNKRDDFFADIDKYTYIELIKKYCPEKMDEKMANVFKTFLLQTGLNHTRILKTLKHR